MEEKDRIIMGLLNLRLKETARGLTAFGEQLQETGIQADEFNRVVRNLSRWERLQIWIIDILKSDV